jgi:hypothetical protein
LQRLQEIRRTHRLRIEVIVSLHSHGGLDRGSTDRSRETERDRERETETETERVRERERDWERERQGEGDREIDRDRERQRDRERDRERANGEKTTDLPELDYVWIEEELYGQRI